VSDPSSVGGVSVNATTAAAASNNTQTANAGGNSGTKSTISSIGELQREQPELYRLMMQGSFVTFMKKNNASQERIKKLNREQYRK
jgi:hypothetical protein